VDALHIVRFFGAYGPFEAERKIYGKLVRRFAIERDPRFTIRGDGKNLIDAMYVDDAMDAILRLLAAPDSGGIYDCASAAPLSVRSLVERAATTFGLTAEITCAGDVPEYIRFYSVDQTMRDRYGFAPRIPLEEGLVRFADFYKRSQSAN
jgi:nucleoside-diphosphate-sugar epimerase